MNKKPKKGDHCVVIESFYNGKPPKLTETEIISAGPKWICTDFDRFNKFDAESLCSDWGGYRLFIGTIIDFEEETKLNARRAELKTEIEKKLDILDVDKLQIIKDVIESL